MTAKLSLFVVVFFSAIASASLAQGELQYNRDIRPILVAKCFACHGADSASREADLRIDQREAAIDAEVLVPGNADESEMIRRLVSDDPEEIMPPPATKKQLTEEQIEILRQWVNEGAEYELHWSYLAPKRPGKPNLASLLAEEDFKPEDLANIKSWPRNPIDDFVLARMLPLGLTPASEADRRTLARRVCLDLTGLPPQPKLVEDFVADESPNAYERLVDRLLASPSWGEHRGRYWLDYARYADTHGIHFDNYREMWAYRDWVIKAFNANMPYDQFTIENLAGDLLPNATLDQQIASGFNRCNMTTNEGGIIDEEYNVLYTRDRTETVAQIWLGLTVNCTVCHSHKFDPLTQKEFYQMAAFFNNSTQKVRDQNIKDPPPTIVVPAEADRARWLEIQTIVEKAKKHTESRRQEARPDFEKWLARATRESLSPPVSSNELHFQAKFDEGDGRTAQALVSGSPVEILLNESASWRDGVGGKGLAVQGSVAEFSDVGDFEADQPMTCSAWINIPANDTMGAIFSRMDVTNAHRGWDLWMQKRQVGMHIISSWSDRSLKVVAKPQVAANRWVHVVVTYDGSRKAAGVKIYYDGKPQATSVENDKLDDSSIRNDVPFHIGSRHPGSPFHGGLQDVRIYTRVLSPEEVAVMGSHRQSLAILAKAPETRTEAEVNDIYTYWLSSIDEEYKSRSSKLAAAERERDDIRSRGATTHVMQERDEPATAFVLNRGEYDQRLEQVSPDTPAVLPPFPADAPRNRLGFAQWLLSPEHPTTSRVTVNRFWQEVFGTGLVRTANDIGVSGELPTHPQLLDWLAIEFRESGWDIKHFFKLMVMSATYRQSSVTTPNKLERDPSNRFYARGPRFRMDAEMVRDYALATSGLLVSKLGGPSVKPYQPPGVWEAIAMNVSNTAKYQRDTGESLYRRSLYTFVKRMAPPASMDIFNAPNREFCTVRRERTNTPLQALVTLNDEQFVEAARHLAELAITTEGSETNSRLDLIGSRLLARGFTSEEITILEQSLQEILSYYEGNLDDARKLLAVGESLADDKIPPAELAAWTMLVNQLMNLDEVLNK